MAKKSPDSYALPKVLSVMRGINVSDAPMYSLAVDGALTPIPVVRHGIRGTQNVAKEKDEAANIQTTETAKTAPDAVGLAVQFALQPIPLHRLITACDNAEFKAKADAFLIKAENSEELLELCRRYARRIFNGSFLWRNLDLAHTLEIEVKSGAQSLSISGNQPFELAQQGFANYIEQELALAKWLQLAFVSEPSAGTGITVTAKVGFANPGAFEVYPSQIYVSSKPAGFARPLYKLKPLSQREMARLAEDTDTRTFSDSFPTGEAAIRDQKIGNAIRTIDTWYEEGATYPIAVEPNGASLSENKFFRDTKSGRSFFTMLPKLAELTEQLHVQPNQDALSADAMFALAVFIRGGVFSDKKDDRQE